jgi:hypothetical protein
MKKVILSFIIILVLIINIDVGEVSADSKSDAMGFDVDSTQYGTYRSYRVSSKYAYHNGVIIGYGELETAVYEDQLDSDYAIIIYHMTTEPIDARIDWLRDYNSYTDYAKINSDVDSGGVSFGYGYYASAADFEMKQPSPSPVANVSTYSVGIEIGKEPKVSATVPIEDSELEIDTNHSSSSEIFEVVYEYSCTNLGFDCSYRNDETYNKATFIIDMSGATMNSRRMAYNRTDFTMKFKDYDWLFGSHTISDYTAVYY